MIKLNNSVVRQPIRFQASLPYLLPRAGVRGRDRLPPVVVCSSRGCQRKERGIFIRERQRGAERRMPSYSHAWRLILPDSDRRCRAGWVLFSINPDRRSGGAVIAGDRMKDLQIVDPTSSAVIMPDKKNSELQVFMPGMQAKIASRTCYKQCE